MLAAWLYENFLRLRPSPMNIKDARDLMLGHATAALPNTFFITYSDLAPEAALNGRAPWARITCKHLDGGQRGFGGDGTQRYVSAGVLCIEIFTLVGTGYMAADDLAYDAKVYLEGIRSSQVWYRNIRAVDVGQDNGYQKTNIYADFEYDDQH